MSGRPMIDPKRRTDNAGATEVSRIAVLIPCRNEALTIGTVVADFRRELPDAEIFVYDNGSSDGTAEAARAAGACVAFERRPGKGVVVGRMLREIEADVYVLVDGDATYPADRVHDLLRPVLRREADMVVGNRLDEFGERAFRPGHLLGNRLVAQSINVSFGSRVQDPMSGYRALSGELVRHLPVVSKGFEIETELTLQTLYRDFVILEVPVPYRSRPAGSHSKLSTYRDGFRVMLTIVDILKAYRPLLFFAVLGTGLALAGIAIGGIPFARYLRTGEIRWVAMLITASALEVMALIAFACGLILDSIKHHFRELSQLVVRGTVKR